MSRRKKKRSLTGIYHWMTRGANQKVIFHHSKDFEYFLRLLSEYRREYGVEIYHYCLLKNHIHLLIHARDVGSMSRFSHYVKRRYAYYYAKRYRWKGSTFQREYRSVPVEKEKLLLECARYIERYPLRGGLVKKLHEYPHSSCGFYTKGRFNDVLTPSPAFLDLAKSPTRRRKIYTRYVTETRPHEEYRDTKELRF